MVSLFKDIPLPGISVIPCRLSGPRGIVKAFLIAAEQTVLVDTGATDVDAAMIAAAVHRAGRRLRDVDLCILTHEHRDHVGGLRWLHDQGGFPVAAHEADVEAIEARAGVRVDRHLGDGERLTQACGLQVLHLPGHTPGSLALYHAATKTLFAGDTLFSSGEWLIPPPPYLCADGGQALASVHRLVDLDLDIENVLVGHGDDVYGPGAASIRLAVQTRRGLRPDPPPSRHAPPTERGI